MNRLLSDPPLPRRRQLGLTMVELMIALLLGLVIVAAMSQLYSGSRKAYQVGDSLTRLNENGRFAVDLIATDLRMAGYLSCGGSRAEIGNTLNSSDWLYETGGIHGFEGGVDTLPSDFSGQVRNGTDVLIVRHAAPEVGGKLVSDDPATAAMVLDAGHGLSAGEIAVISNPQCTQATLFQVSGVTGTSVSYAANSNGATPGNCTSSRFGDFDCSSGSAANLNFDPQSAISRYVVDAYYVTASDPPTLARKRLCHKTGSTAICDEELIRDVENFQILYGRDTEKDDAGVVDDYVTANQVTDWDDVVSVRFALLMRSRDANVRTAITNDPLNLLDKTISTPSDRHLRRIFGNVVALRNNLP